MAGQYAVNNWRCFMDLHSAGADSDLESLRHNLARLQKDILNATENGMVFEITWPDFFVAAGACDINLHDNRVALDRIQRSCIFVAYVYLHE